MSSGLIHSRSRIGCRLAGNAPPFQHANRCLAFQFLDEGLPVTVGAQRENRQNQIGRMHQPVFLYAGSLIGGKLDDLIVGDKTSTTQSGAPRMPFASILPASQTTSTSGCTPYR